MILKLPTYSKKLILWFDIETEHKLSLILIGYDEEFPDTQYFYRRIPINKKKRVNIPLPLSPERLTIEIFDEAKPDAPYPDTFKIRKFEFKGLTYRKKWDSKTKEFIDLVQWFSEEAGYLDTGEHYSKNGNFLIVYKEQIVNEDGEEFTPARIEKQMKFIEISKAYMKDLTIPERQVVLFHEFAHGFVNKHPESEVEADLEGNKIYLALGNSETEIMYAYQNVFNDTPTNRRRVRKVYNMISRKNLFTI